MFFKFYKNQLFRYVLVAGTNVIAGYGVFALLIFFKLHYTLPAVVIFPVIEEKARELLTQTLGADWAKRMIWKDKRVSTCAIDTLAYPGVNTLVHNAREQGFDAVYFTSANKPGEPTISNLEEVQKVFPGITGYNDWTSYTAIDVTLLPKGKMRLERIGSLSVQVLKDFSRSLLPGLEINDSDARKNLTTIPAFNCLPATKVLFKEIGSRF